MVGEDSGELIGASRGRQGAPRLPQFSPELVTALGHFARRIAAGRDVSDVLDDLPGRVDRVLRLAGAGVSLLREDGLHFVACASERHAELARVQDTGNGHEAEGPCVEAAGTGEQVLVEDLAAAAQRWPRYVQVARRLGIRSVAALPLRADAVVGTLELYGDAPRPWREAELAVAQVFADVAAGYLRAARELDRQRRVSAQLQDALDSRVVIEQAKGVIAAQRGVGVDEAFRILRKHANDHGATLRVVAETVIGRGLRL